MIIELIKGENNSVLPSKFLLLDDVGISIDGSGTILFKKGSKISKGVNSTIFDKDVNVLPVASEIDTFVRLYNTTAMNTSNQVLIDHNISLNKSVNDCDIRVRINIVNSVVTVNSSLYLNDIKVDEGGNDLSFKGCLGDINGLNIKIKGSSSSSISADIVVEVMI